MLKIVIVGYGFVGKSVHKSFEHNADTTIIDPKYSTAQIHELGIATDIVFVCLPAPTLPNGSVDSTLIYNVFSQLCAIKFSGIVVLKSTLPPAVVDNLQQFKLNYVYSPEFLREKSWEDDAINPGRIVLAGEYRYCKQVKEWYRNHSHIPRNTQFMLADYKEAALLKYAANTFLATKVVFMNQLQQLYIDIYGASQPESWKEFTELLSADMRIGNSHMDVPGTDGKYGYGGSCFPKDVSAMIGFDTQNRMSVLREAELANTRIRLTGCVDPD